MVNFKGLRIGDTIRYTRTDGPFEDEEASMKAQIFLKEPDHIVANVLGSYFGREFVPDNDPWTIWIDKGSEGEICKIPM